MMTNRLISETPDVGQVLYKIKSLAPSDADPLTTLGKSMDDYRTQYTQKLFDMEQWFLRFGRNAMDLFNQLQPGNDLDRSLAPILLNKHQAYGAAPLLRWGITGVVIRLDSKLQRVVNLLKGDVYSDESVADTLFDMVGYCVLGYYVAAHERKESRK